MDMNLDSKSVLGRTADDEEVSTEVLVDSSSDNTDVNPDTKLDLSPVFESSNDVADGEYNT